MSVWVSVLTELATLAALIFAHRKKIRIGGCNFRSVRAIDRLTSRISSSSPCLLPSAAAPHRSPFRLHRLSLNRHYGRTADAQGHPRGPRTFALFPPIHPTLGRLLTGLIEWLGHQLGYLHGEVRSNDAITRPYLKNLDLTDRPQP